MLTTVFQDYAISSPSHLAAEFPDDGRSALDFHRSIVDYLRWRTEQGRTYSRARRTRHFHEYSTAKHVVISAFWAKEPHPMKLVGSISQSDLPAAVSGWPLALRIEHERIQQTAAAKVKAATQQVLRKEGRIKAAKLDFQLRRKGVSSVRPSYSDAVLEGTKIA